MRETREDTKWLQALLDRSHAEAGDHLVSVFRDDLRASAEDLTRLLTGVQVLHLATVSSFCEPRVAPVGGIFFRSRFYFGSSREALRYRHIRRRPQVSASLAHAQELGVIVHGIAVQIDTSAPEHAGFRELLIGIYAEDRPSWGEKATYSVIRPTKMFAHMLTPSEPVPVPGSQTGFEPFESPATDLVRNDINEAADI